MPDSATPWQYTRTQGSGAAWTTNVTDPQGNVTVLNFQGIYETERQAYQGAATGTPLLNKISCYNNNPNPCTSASNSTAITLPITQLTVLKSLNGGSSSKTVQTYDSTYTLPLETDVYDYGGTTLLRKSVVAYNSALTNNIHDRPSSVVVCAAGGTASACNGSGTVVAQTSYAYDQGTPTPTSGTPQHVSVSGSRGNPTTASATGQSMGTLTRTYTYYDTGLVNQATDVNLAQTSYPSGNWTCGNAFPTQANLPASLYRYMTWNCTGAVLSSVYDGNTAPTKYTYTFSDPNFWRPTAVQDPTSAVTNISYSVNPSSGESVLNFNGTTSTADVYSQLDALGRVYLTQRKQSQSSTSYDSVQTTYDALGRPSKVSPPYTAAKQGAYTGSTFTTTTYDALGRVTQVAAAGGGTASYSYSKNDVLVTVNAPSGENSKQRQLEYDAVGRLTSVCEIVTDTVHLLGSGNCAQNTAKNGYWTKYTYDALNNLTGVTQNAQSGSTQTRSYSFDGLGRLTSETNAESGTTTYIYDTDSTCGTYKGDRVKRLDRWATSPVTTTMGCTASPRSTSAAAPISPARRTSTTAMTRPP